MKKFLILIALLSFLTGCSQVRQNEEVAPNWHTAYSAILLDFANSGEYPRAAFSVRDVNGDGVPELFVSKGVGRVDRCFVYTFSDESVMLDELGEYGCVGLDTAIDQLVSTNMTQGYEWVDFYELREDNSLECVRGFYNNLGREAGTDEVEFHINGEAVPEEEYRAAFAEYSEHEVLWLGRDNELTAETASAVAMGEYN